MRSTMTEERATRIAEQIASEAAAGQVYFLLVGPPGTGKTMVARRVARALPDAAPEVVDEQATIERLRGLSEPHNLAELPFRAPHHSASLRAMLGAVTRRETSYRVTPGELSLAHGGVLFLDELPEFTIRVVREIQRTVERGTVNLGHDCVHVSLPARPAVVIASANPCPCGYLDGTVKGRVCACPPSRVRAYQGRTAAFIGAEIIDMETAGR